MARQETKNDRNEFPVKPAEHEEEQFKVDDDMSPRTRTWKENERKLAMKLARSPLCGKEGLQHILLEIIKA